MCNKETKCTGYCCKGFWLPYSPEQLQDKAARLLGVDKPPPEGFEASGLPKVFDVSWDNHVMFFAFSAIFLGKGNAPYPGVLEGIEQESVGAQGYYYTCKHRQRNGKCSIYSLRPTTCSSYPEYLDHPSLTLPNPQKCRYVWCSAKQWRYSWKMRMKALVRFWWFRLKHPSVFLQTLRMRWRSWRRI